MAMDCDLVRRQTRSGRKVTQLVLLPDADISEPENESDSEYEQADVDSDANSFTDSDDEIPLAQLAASSSRGHADSEDDVPLSEIAGKRTAQTQKQSHTFRWRKINALKQGDTEWKGKFSDPPDVGEPISYFKQFLSSKVVEHSGANEYLLSSAGFCLSY